MARRALGTEPRLVLRRGSRYEPRARAGTWLTLEDMAEDASPWAPSAPAVDDVRDAAVGKRAEGVAPAAVAAAPGSDGETTVPAGAADAVPQPPSGPADVPSVDRAAAFRPGPVPPAPAVPPAEGATAPGGDEGTAPPGDRAPEAAVAAPSPGDEVSKAMFAASPPGGSGSPSRRTGVRGEEPEHVRSPHADTPPSRAGWPSPSSTAALGALVASRSGTVGTGVHGVREPDLGQAPGTTPPASPDAPGPHGVPRDAVRPPAVPLAAADDRDREQPVARTGRSPGTTAPAAVAPPPDRPSPEAAPAGDRTGPLPRRRRHGRNRCPPPFRRAARTPARPAPPAVPRPCPATSGPRSPWRPATRRPAGCPTGRKPGGQTPRRPRTPGRIRPGDTARSTRGGPAPTRRHRSRPAPARALPPSPAARLLLSVPGSRSGRSRPPRASGSGTPGPGRPTP